MISIRYCCREPDLQHVEECQIICMNCGQLIKEESITVGPVWKQNDKDKSSNQTTTLSINNQNKMIGTTLRIRQMESDKILNNEKSFQQGKRQIKFICQGIDLEDNDVKKKAIRLFQLAIEYGKVKSRRRDIVCACCIYIACRLKKQPYLLIDFSDFLQINVHVLGKIFCSLCRELHMDNKTMDINVNIFFIVEPECLLRRYCHNKNLKLGKKKENVCEIALRILTHMRYHWILTGRIPNGVLGACVTLAAQKLGFNVKETDLVPIVKVSECTIRKRISEFFSTSSVNLTLKQWMEKQEKNCLQNQIKKSQPPAFKIKNLKKMSESKLKIKYKIISRLKLLKIKKFRYFL